MSGAAGGDGRPRQARRPFGICSSVWRRAGVPAATRAPAGAGLGEADGEVHCLPGRTAPDCQVEPGRPHWDGPRLPRRCRTLRGPGRPRPRSTRRGRRPGAVAGAHVALALAQQLEDGFGGLHVSSWGVGAGRAQRPRRRPDDVDVNYHRVVDHVNAVARAAAKSRHRTPLIPGWRGRRRRDQPVGPPAGSRARKNRRSGTKSRSSKGARCTISLPTAITTIS